MRRFLLFFLCALLMCAMVLPLCASDEQTRVFTVSTKWDDSKHKFVMTTILSDPTISNAPPASVEEMPALAEQLGATEKTAQSLAMLRMAQSGDSAIPFLRETTRSANSVARRNAALVLVTIGTKPAISAIREMPLQPLLLDINSDDLEAQRYGALLLALIGKDEIVSTIRSIIQNDNNSDMQTGAILGAIQGSQRIFLPDIAQSMRSANPETRGCAVMAYMYLGDKKQAEDALFPLLPDPNPVVRMMLLPMLSNMHSARGYDTLITTMLFDEEPTLRTFAALGLKEDARRSTVQYLLRATHDPEADVSHAAISSLEDRAASPEIIKVLRALQNDTDPNVKSAATDLLNKRQKK